MRQMCDGSQVPNGHVFATAGAAKSDILTHADQHTPVTGISVPLPGKAQLSSARTLLAPPRSGREQTLAATQQVWSAMFYSSEWPLALQNRARALEPMLFKYGTIDMTIAHMSDTEIDEMRGQLAAFLQSFP
jgi:hypothetical protein